MPNPSHNDKVRMLVIIAPNIRINVIPNICAESKRYAADVASGTGNMHATPIFKLIVKLLSDQNKRNIRCGHES
jgi:hypothetical protein